MGEEEEEDKLIHSTTVQFLEIDELLPCEKNNNFKTSLTNSSANIRSTNNNNNTKKDNKNDSSAKPSLCNYRQDLDAMSVASIYLKENEFEAIE